jgi:hypothetical protein
MIAEKLNFWDRIFNRKRQEVIEEGKETWTRHYMDSDGETVASKSFVRHFVKYRIIDRVTGSVTIKKKYL